MGSEHQYRLTLTETTENTKAQSLTLDFQDREDIFDVLNKLKSKEMLSEEEATKLGIALRLLGPTLMQNRKHSLFVDFFPHFRAFMLNLKNKKRA